MNYQLAKIAQTYTNKIYNREDSVKASEEIVKMVIEDLATYQEYYNTNDMFELIEKVANDVVNEMSK